jgi:hypothetical protein
MKIFEQLSLSKLADTQENISSVPGPLSQLQASSEAGQVWTTQG